jgi:hypothetical protein
LPHVIRDEHYIIHNVRTSSGAGPSVVGGLLAIGIGVSGLVYISVNLLAGKGKNVSRLKIVFCFAVLLFFVANGIMQLMTVR